MRASRRIWFTSLSYTSPIWLSNGNYILFVKYIIAYLIRLGRRHRSAQSAIDVDQLIEGVIDGECGYVNNPADKGGPTCFGITEAVARAQGYAGTMRNLPREEAAAIYRRLYWSRPYLDEVAERSTRVAAELFDTGVNMGPAVAHLPSAGAHGVKSQRRGLSRSRP